MIYAILATLLATSPWLPAVFTAVKCRDATANSAVRHGGPWMALWSYVAMAESSPRCTVANTAVRPNGMSCHNCFCRLPPWPLYPPLRRASIEDPTAVT